MTSARIRPWVVIQRSWRDREDPSPTHASRRHGESGSTLVLALIFMVVIGMLVGTMASWTTTNLHSTLIFQQQRNVQNSLSSATNVALQSIRYTPLLGSGISPQTLNASPPSTCWVPSSGTTSTLVPPQVAYSVDVWCSTVWNPTSADTRVVTISACLSSVDNGNAALCAQKPGQQIVVTFDDYSATNPNINNAPCTAPPTGTCGSGMTISSSLLNITAPAISGLSPTSGPATGGGTLTITGSGFAAGTPSVSFVGTNARQNLTVMATNVSVSSDTQLSVTIPPATTVTTYNVIVTTPNGASTATSQSQYQYQPVVPTVSRVTVGTTGSATGSAAGGTTVTITGTGFLSASGGDSSTVEFVDTQNSSTVYNAQSNTVTVNSTGTQLTAATPAIASTDMTYYVLVKTAPGGVSAVGPTFVFQPVTPVVASAYNAATQGASGGSNATVTLTGVGFVNGATTVQLVPTSFGASTLNATGVSVSNSTTLTATIPSGGTSNSTYYVEVTTTSGGSSSPNGAPIFTYT